MAEHRGVFWALGGGRGLGFARKIKGCCDTAPLLFKRFGTSIT